jgi:hypothetical protein
MIEIERLLQKLISHEAASFSTAPVEAELCAAIMRVSNGTVILFAGRVTVEVHQTIIPPHPPKQYVKTFGDMNVIPTELLHERRRFPRDAMTIMAATGDEASRIARKIARRLKEG